MKTIIKKLIVVGLLVCTISGWAKEHNARELYPFTSLSKQQRFQQLITELRCLVCQNQTIAESNASLAEDLRNQIYQKVQQGESAQTIIAYLTDRYGQFILYRPPFNLATLLLWLGPALFLLCGIGFLLFYLRKPR